MSPALCHTYPLHINHLPNHILLRIFAHVPLPDLLPLELVCQRWRLLQDLLLCRVTTLVLLGPTRPTIHQTTALQLIQKATQRYAVSVASSRHFLPLGRSGLTFRTVELLLRKLPNITRLELVQVSLVTSVDLVVYLLNGWSLTTLKVLIDEKVNFIIWGGGNGRKSGDTPTRPHWSRRFLKQSEKKKPKRFDTCLHTLLAHLTPSWQPYLRHLTLLTFDSLSTKLPDAYFDLSQLEALHIIRPWETNRLLPQLLLSSHLHTWTSLTSLTLYSDGNFTQLLRDYFDYLRPVFHNLTFLSLNFTTRTILSMIRQSCYHLGTLHLACVTLPFVELALELEPLQFQLTELKLTFPYQSLDRTIEWSSLEAGPQKIPQFHTLKHLHLVFSTLLHAPVLATPILEHLFPKLESLTLDRNRIENPTSGPSCEKCSRMRCITAFSCKHNLVEMLRRSQMTCLRTIKVMVEVAVGEDVSNSNSPLAEPNALSTYEIFEFKRRLWTIASEGF